MARRQGTSPRQIFQNRIPITTSMLAIGTNGKEATARSERDAFTRSCELHLTRKRSLNNATENLLAEFQEIGEQLTGINRRSSLGKLGVSRQESLYSEFATHNRQIMEQINLVNANMDQAAEKNRLVEELSAN